MKKALVLSLAVVLGLGVASFAQTLSGSWTTTVGIEPSPVVLTIDSELIVTYAVSGWSFTSDTLIDSTGWYGQTFTVDGALGAFTLGSTLDFPPFPPAFNYWLVTGGLSLAGVTFDATFGLVPNNTSLDIVASGTAGSVTVGAAVSFGDPIFDANGAVLVYDEETDPGYGCDFDWHGITITVDFPFCCATIASEIVFDCTGFQYVTFEVDGIAIPTLPWVSLDAVLKFTVAEKTLVLKPVFDFGVVACFDLYLGQIHEDAQGGGAGNHIGLLQDIQINGIGLNCEIGGVEFTGISYWGAPGTGNASKPGLLKYTNYWEAYQIATTDDGCCGPFAFDITVYFEQGGAQLFDVAEFDANMSIQIATQFTFTMGIVIDLPAFTEWSLGFIVEW